MTLIRWRPFRDLKHWEPFGEVDTLKKEMETLLERFVPEFGRSMDGTVFVPSAEIDETETEFHLKLEVPGMSAEDLDIEVTDQAVLITGERKSETKSEEDNTLRSEFYYGKFERYVPLPSQIQRDHVAAEYKDGILNLTLPKAKEQKEKATKVKVA
ncbi:Hsp20/alpha crystallin family protein [Leptolyngbya sp. KIOST-1]|uniref:Hsp20/alpha crystallin family protein n=1 Tax=Leptolyngbya sp. KIOST-1 TaxID=1229172 RepID=UPI00055D58BD|nr:Hsp20/alpha crystallin family protein [Leptolyngbya sp. KIOST-1]